MKYLKYTAYTFLLIGGLNWGIYGLFGYDLVDVLLGFEPMFARIVYDIVGLSTLFVIFSFFSSRSKCCHDCKGCSIESKKTELKNKDLEEETKIFEIKTGEEINTKN